MAGLLETIAKRLFGSNECNYSQYTTRTATRTTPNATIKVNSIEQPTPKATETNITAIDRTNKRERTHRELGREDYLLNQIDEFREKAQQLQDLLLSKESKVLELQTIVDERESKAKELEEILNERQRKADGITEEVSKQIDTLIEKVSAKMDEIGTSVGKELEDGQKLSEQQAEALKETLSSLTTQLETLKADLSEKVHSENVKCYRNVSDLFKSMEDKLDKVNEVEQKIDSVRKSTIAIIVLAVINMVGLAALALYELGIFQLLLG